MAKEIIQLKSWLNVPGNTPAALAAMLGYKTSVVISQWIRRKKIPSYQVDRVMEIIQNGKSVKSSQTRKN